MPCMLLHETCCLQVNETRHDSGWTSSDPADSGWTCSDPARKRSFSQRSFDKTFSSFIAGVHLNHRAGIPSYTPMLQIQPFLCTHDKAKLCSRPSSSPRVDHFSLFFIHRIRQKCHTYHFHSYLNFFLSLFQTFEFEKPLMWWCHMTSVNNFHKISPNIWAKFHIPKGCGRYKNKGLQKTPN